MIIMIESVGQNRLYGSISNRHNLFGIMDHGDALSSLLPGNGTYTYEVGDNITKLGHLS